MAENKKITAVISVLNEEITVGDVVKTTLNCRMVDEVIVVNDGSTDATAGFTISLIFLFGAGQLKGQLNIDPTLRLIYTRFRT